MKQEKVVKKAKLLGAFQLGFTGAYITVILAAVFIVSHHFATQNRQNVVELTGILLTWALLMFAVSQITLAMFALRFVMLQMLQAEELSADSMEAQRETNRLLLLLTKRPEPQPAQMNLALFNLPKRTP